MIKKINDLKTKSNSKEVIILCETAIASLTSSIYNNVPDDAKKEIERIAIKNLFEDLSTIKDKEVKDWLKTEKRLYTIKNLGIRESISSLLEKDENTHIRTILEEYKEYLNRGISEVLLYEQYISALQSFSYFPSVGNAIKSISDRVNEYKNDVDITKIIEVMKGTRSNYLVPLIEDVVNNYITNKTEQTKSQLKETLVKFTYDPFVRDIVSIVSLDAADLQLEYANAECDIEKIYSPLMYIGENEVVFNVKGMYYIKKGNNINKLPIEDYSKLDERYVALCDLIDSSNVVFERKAIKLYDKHNKAVITESGVEINGQKLTNESFKTAVENSYWGGGTDFFIKVELLRENFNDIAEVDFVKRVYLKEQYAHSADVFKLRDNIFITIHNPETAKSTFYRNINPIQAKNIMTEHLNFDISNTFSNLLPDEEKIVSQINETKKSYNDYIDLLESKIVDFKNHSISAVTTNVIRALEEELNEVKDEFKDYLNRAEVYTRLPEYINEEESGITVTIDVKGKKYTVPIPVEAVKDVEKNSDNVEDAGTVVGSEDVDDKAATAITFDDEESELLSDTPSMGEDEVDLGSEEIEANADSVEADKEAAEEKDKEEQEAEAEDNEEEEGADNEEEEKTEESVENSKPTKLLKETGEKTKKRKVYLKKKSS